MNNYSDDDQDSLPGVFRNRLSEDIDGDFFHDKEKEVERLRTEQIFNDMNNQIRELVSLVKTLTEHFTLSKSNSERNTHGPRGENAPNIATLSPMCY